ncbi:MAG: dienelactone hydrolase family protein [Sedimenticola sp.]
MNKRINPHATIGFIAASIFISGCNTNKPKVARTGPITSVPIHVSPSGVQLENSSLVPYKLSEWASRSKDLTFPTKITDFGFFSSPRLSLYKPEGNGPFPAVVLQHQCGGLTNTRTGWTNRSMLEWAKRAVDKGYVALLMDSLSPRGVGTVCYGFRGGVNWGRGFKDVQQGAQHLRTLDYVDKDRVYLAGFSWGASIALLASSSTAVESIGTPGRFNAIASFYPVCRVTPRRNPPYEIITENIDRPLLVFMGDKDNETPPQDCIDRLEPMRQRGAPIELFLYQDVTHCFDCSSLNGFRKTDVKGDSIVYYYDEQITNHAADRMFKFFEESSSR